MLKPPSWETVQGDNDVSRNAHLSGRTEQIGGRTGHDSACADQRAQVGWLDVQLLEAEPQRLALYDGGLDLHADFDLSELELHLFRGCVGIDTSQHLFG